MGGSICLTNVCCYLFLFVGRNRQGGKFFFNDNDSKQLGSGGSGGGKSSKPFLTMKKVGQLFNQFFAKKKGASDDTGELRSPNSYAYCCAHR